MLGSSVFSCPSACYCMLSISILSVDSYSVINFHTKSKQSISSVNFVISSSYTRHLALAVERSPSCETLDDVLQLSLSVVLF